MAGALTWWPRSAGPDLWTQLPREGTVDSRPWAVRQHGVHTLPIVRLPLRARDNSTKLSVCAKVLI